VNRLTELTKDARLYMGGQELTDIHTTDIRNRLNEGMSRLVEQVYTNLKMLTIEYDDEMLKSIINTTTFGALFGTEMDNCMTEVFNYINRNKQLSVRTKVKDLVEYFKGNSYGWYETATLCIMAKLYKMDKISFRSNGGIVADRDLYTNMTNTNQQAVLIIDIEETITNSQISKLKNLYKEFFEDESCSAQSAKDVHNAFIERLKTEIDNLHSIRNVWPFNFVRPLDEIIPMLEQLKGNVYPGLYSKTAQIEKAIDRKVDEADAISEFISNPQFSIFKRIDTLKKGNQANLVYVTAELKNALEDIYSSSTPWKLMTKAKEVLDAISDEIKAKQESACEEVLNLLDSKMQS
jgi:hypothetical protein